MKKKFLKYIVSMVSYTNRLILINIVMFFAFLILVAVNQNFMNYIELKPENILAGKYLWTIITSMFMHQGGVHLFVNMVSLFFLGNLTEQIIGRKRFLILYFLAGIAGSIFFVFGAWFGNLSGTTQVFGELSNYAAGASGALFGLLGILAVLIPKYKAYLIAGPLIILILEIVLLPFLPSAMSNVFEIVFGVLMILSIFAMFSRNNTFRKLAVPIGLELWLAPIVAIIPLVIISFFVSLPIGNTAHLGGLVIGLIYGIILKLKYPKKTALLDRMFLR